MRYDVIIVGGGLVGMGLAIALRQTNAHVALIDARLPSQNDSRLFALNYSSCQFLKNLGIWPQLEVYAAPIDQVYVSYQGHFGSVRLNAADAKLPSLGYVIPASVIEMTMNDVVAALPNVAVYRPAKLKQLTQQADAVNVMIESDAQEKMLVGTIVVGADGAESTVREQINMATEREDGGQVAIVTRTQLSRSHQNIAYERFNAHGAIAMLPLLDHESATIWSADKARAEYLLGLSEETFRQELQQAFGYRLGRLQKTGQRYAYPLRTVCAKNSVDGRVFLLGNAAHTMHPIAAQGFNLALYEVALLVEEILADQKDFTKWQDRIKMQQAVSMNVSRQLSRLFLRGSIWKSCLLQLGMVGLDVAAPLKRQFINRVIGYQGKIPALLLSAQE